MARQKVVRNKHNTPVIIKYPFWQMTARNPRAIYACINYGQAVCPKEIEHQSICIDSDVGECIKQLLERMGGYRESGKQNSVQRTHGRKHAFCP